MIAKAIYDILINDATLTAMGVDISPIWTDTAKQVPMITYAFDDNFQYTKKQSDTISTELAFMIASDNYIEMSDICTQLVSVLDKFSGISQGVSIRSIDVQNAEEERDKTSGLYMKGITFIAIWNQ